jgi:hypothetical protein
MKQEVATQRIPELVTFLRKTSKEWDMKEDCDIERGGKEDVSGTRLGQGMNSIEAMDVQSTLKLS